MEVIPNTTTIQMLLHKSTTAYSNDGEYVRALLSTVVCLEKVSDHAGKLASPALRQDPHRHSSFLCRQMSKTFLSSLMQCEILARLNCSHKENNFKHVKEFNPRITTVFTKFILRSRQTQARHMSADVTHLQSFSLSLSLSIPF